VTLATIPSRYVAFQGITKVQSPELTWAGFCNLTTPWFCRIKMMRKQAAAARVVATALGEGVAVPWPFGGTSGWGGSGEALALGLLDPATSHRKFRIRPRHGNARLVPPKAGAGVSRCPKSQTTSRAAQGPNVPGIAARRFPCRPKEGASAGIRGNVQQRRRTSKTSPPNGPPRRPPSGTAPVS
jgi:hypothetical protein